MIKRINIQSLDFNINKMLFYWHSRIWVTSLGSDDIFRCRYGSPCLCKEMCFPELRLQKQIYEWDGLFFKVNFCNNSTLMTLRFSRGIWACLAASLPSRPTAPRQAKAMSAGWKLTSCQRSSLCLRRWVCWQGLEQGELMLGCSQVSVKHKNSTRWWLN